MSMKTITTDNFQSEVLASTTPVLLDFWAPWCTYCKRLSPVLDRLSQQFGEEIVIGKVNIDDNPQLATQYNVDVIPTLFFFQDGKPGDKLVAPPSQAQIENCIQDQKEGRK